MFTPICTMHWILISLFREEMKKNAKWISQFHGKDDHLVPLEEGRKVHSAVGSFYYLHFLLNFTL
jgi:hypothetical protein